MEDPFFKSKYVDEVPNPNTVVTPSHFWKDPNGLLYFMDADWNSRLCVPKSEVNYVLNWIHDSPFESAHAGATRFIARLSEMFFWKTLIKDANEFADTCNICQKIKADHRKKMGALRPAHIPTRPFATVSLDLITGLPPSGEETYTAVLVIVCKLTKFAIIIPTHDTLDREGFAKLFTERVANVFGLLDRIIADRDKRWATNFWKSVVAQYGSVMALDVAGTGRKLVQQTIGPFKVLERINPVVYRLRLPDSYSMHPVFNIAHLKKYKPSPAHFGDRSSLPSTRDFIATQEYEVEAILGHKLTARSSGNRRMYLVRWAGYGPTDDSWISEYDLRNAPELKREYLALHSLN